MIPTPVLDDRRLFYRWNTGWRVCIARRWRLSWCAISGGWTLSLSRLIDE